MLPQHARHCPVLEAGSAAGFLVYPPLEPNESFHLSYEGDGLYRFVYYLRPPGGGDYEAVFLVVISLPAGSVGMIRQEVQFMAEKPLTTRENALRMARTFFVPEDLGTPLGAVALRGSTNFQTPPGWDTIYTPIFNMIERPLAPMLIIRVETDWYAHETEFRYVMQPGEGITAEHTIPIGQVLFVPREEITMRDCTEEEVAAIRRSEKEFYREKTALKLATPYGLEYSPHYFRESRARKEKDKVE